MADNGGRCKAAPSERRRACKRWETWISWKTWKTAKTTFMRAFTTNDLNKQVGEVTDAATKAPIVITRHRKPRFVMMSYEHYERIKATADPRRVYGTGETPDEVAALFSAELERLATGDGYDDGR